MIYISEITPKNIRGKAVAMLSIPFGVGELVVCFLSIMFLSKDFSDGNWRALLVAAAIPSLITSILGYMYLLESPRYLLFKECMDSSIDMMKKISIINGK